MNIKLFFKSLFASKLKLILLFFSLFIYFYSLKFYIGNSYIYTFFSIIFNLVLFIGLRKDRMNIDLFVGLYFWLGFWLKFSLRISVHSSQFVDKVGFFDFSPSSYDNALLVASIGGIAFLCARLVRGLIIKNPLLDNINRNPIESRSAFEKVYLKHRIKIWCLFIMLIIFVSSTNFYFGIYQKGMVPKVNLPFSIGRIYSWLLLFGMGVISSVLLNCDLKFYKKLDLRLLVLVFFESILSSVSMLSRAFIINISALVVGLHQSINHLKIKVNALRISFLFGLVVSFFVVSIFASNLFRFEKYLDMDTSKLTKVENLAVKVHYVWESTVVLFVDRFVGIEGVMAVTAYPNKGWDLWSQAVQEKYKDYGTSFYDLNVIKSPYSQEMVRDKHFISLPGIVAFFYYPGSIHFMFCALFLVYLFASGIEYLAFNLSGYNFIFTSVIGQVMAYRFSNFGYVPTQSYLLIMGIFCAIFMAYGSIIKSFNFSISRILTRPFSPKKN